jgi:hypothetical protein
MIGCIDCPYCAIPPALYVALLPMVEIGVRGKVPPPVGTDGGLLLPGRYVAPEPVLLPRLYIGRSPVRRGVHQGDDRLVSLGQHIEIDPAGWRLSVGVPVVGEPRWNACSRTTGWAGGHGRRKRARTPGFDDHILCEWHEDWVVVGR